MHLHTHMIVSWGGINPTTGCLKVIKGEYVNYSFLKTKFRCKFEDKLVELFDTGTLNHDFKDRIAFMRFLKRINDKNWIIHLEPPMENPEAVVRYIGRYSKRACLSEYKITSMAGEYISFNYKNYKKQDKSKKPIIENLTLHYNDFFPRLLQHVPLPYFRIVRYYGVYANRVKIPTEYKFKSEVELSDQDHDNWETLQLQKTGENPLICKHCQTRKQYQYTIIKKPGQKPKKIFISIFSDKAIPDQKVA